MAPLKWEVVNINNFLSFLWQCRIWAILLYPCHAKETDSNFPMSQHDIIEEASTICHILSFATILIPQLTQTEIIHHNNKCKHTYVHTNTLTHTSYNDCCCYNRKRRNACTVNLVYLFLRYDHSGPCSQAFKCAHVFLHIFHYVCVCVCSYAEGFV